MDQAIHIQSRNESNCTDNKQRRFNLKQKIMVQIYDETMIPGWIREKCEKNTETKEGLIFTTHERQLDHKMFFIVLKGVKIENAIQLINII